MTTLAIQGGSPIRKTFLPYGRHTIDDQDVDAVVRALRAEWITCGPLVSQFEKALAEYVGAVDAVVLSSGTAALHAAVNAVGVGDGDEVLVPALTFVATANSVLFAGARPVFVDILPGTLNMDPEDAERKISPRTKLIMPVDFAGQPCDHDSLGNLAERHGLRVVEDAAHALGASYRGRAVGTIHEFTTFSLHPVKHITTGEGGVVIVDSEEVATKIRAFRNHGISLGFRDRMGKRSWKYDVASLGYNYRLPDINCALGLSQLRKHGRWIQRRREIAAQYTVAFRRIPGIELPMTLPWVEHAWHLYVVLLRLDMLKAGRDEIHQALLAENIGVNVHYLPVYLHPLHQGLEYRRGLCPVAEKIFQRLLTLPLYPAMSDDDVQDVIHGVEKVIGAYLR